MKNKIFLSLLFIPVLCSIFMPFKTMADDYLLRASVDQQIEILQREIFVLQLMISNMSSRGEISAGSYQVKDLSNNSVIIEKNSEVSRPIASVTKLMSAVIALENINMTDKITLTNEMLTPEGNSPVIYNGLTITAQDLLTAAMTQSSNDAVEAISYFVGKNQFLNLMNQKAQSLGMQNTIFYDVHGLNPLNRSTASDLVKLVSYVYNNHPEILSITKRNDFWLPNSQGKMFKFQNTTNFYYLDEFVGGKTGYTPKAKQTFASVFNINGKSMAITLLYSQNRMADIFKILNQLKSKI